MHRNDAKPYIDGKFDQIRQALAAGDADRAAGVVASIADDGYPEVAEGIAADLADLAGQREAQAETTNTADDCF
jgi:hypothetical protein